MSLSPFRIRSFRRPAALWVLSLALVLLSCADGATANGKLAKGAAADFRLQTVDGSRKLGPSDFKGQVVLIDFWATWCAPCRIQGQILEPVVRDLKGRGVQFLGANVGEEVEVVRKFLKEHPPLYPTLVDPSDEASTRLGILSLPTLVVVDKKGKIAYINEGLTDGDTLRKVIRDAGK